MLILQRILKHTDLLIGAAMLVIIAMLILPIPEWALDVGLVAAIAVSAVIILGAINVKDPLEFSVFPSLLLLTTLFRLALSIAATKLILGTGSAGHVIETFGTFVLGGDFVVGFVAFIILMIVQFIVITNGATRVSEVVARFTLDAMPGKQMAIDADLASGLIEEEEAKERRKKVKNEADFYGSMDGASKFVKGDAIASMLIIVVNILGGFAVGFMRGEGDATTILQTYAILSVGEGLVSQIPALLISTSSGLLVTRNGQENGMGGTLALQMMSQSKILTSAGIAVMAFGLIPGFPLITFAIIGGTILTIGRISAKNPHLVEALKPAKPEKKNPVEEALPPTGPEGVLALVQVDPLEIEIGYGLTTLADARAGGDLSERVAGTRRQLALELGFVMPSVRIRDNAQLDSNEYIIKVKGEEVARAHAIASGLLAIASSDDLPQIDGSPVKEPVFGLDALWIEADTREQAERAGYTVVEPTAMISTHLSEICKRYAPELLSRQDVQRLIENAKNLNEAVVEELIPARLQVGDVQKVLQHLLRENVPIRDMVSVLEIMADFAERVKDMEQLGELTRAAMSRTITRQYVDHNNTLNCLTLEPSLEKQITEMVQQTAGGSFLALEPALQQEFLEQVRAASDKATANGHMPVLLCSANLRLPLKKVLERYIPQLPILAYNEIAESANVEFVGQVALLSTAA